MISATAAYRKDLAANGKPFGGHDGAWLTVASLVEAAALGIDESATESWEGAIGAAVDALGAAELDRLSSREWGASWSSFDPLTLLAIAMHDAGARALSVITLDALLRVRSGQRDVAYGRALAQRARAAYLTGEHEVASDLYGQVDAIGRRMKSVELRARAACGLVGLAQVRGNHPEMFAQAQRALELAERTTIPRLRWSARYSMMLGSALFRRYDEALDHGWQLFELVKGDQSGEALALHSLGQMLFEMGDTEGARAAFAAVVSRPLSADMLLAALGSLALTVAVSETDRKTFEWAVSEIQSFRESTASQWSYASALLDCTIALRDAGRIDEAREMHRELLTLSRTHGFHALAYRAESIALDAAPSRPERTFAGTSTREIIRSVRELAPRRLPRHVRLVAAHV